VDKPDRKNEKSGNNEGGQPHKKPAPVLVNLGLTSQIGLTMAASVLVGLFIGHKLDQWSGGGHLWMIVSIPLGIASGFWAVYKIIDKVLTCDEKNK
jgi:F0F1-type ATP synthase assembly protein I